MTDIAVWGREGTVYLLKISVSVCINVVKIGSFYIWLKYARNMVMLKLNLDRVLKYHVSKKGGNRMLEKKITLPETNV